MDTVWIMLLISAIVVSTIILLSRNNKQKQMRACPKCKNLTESPFFAPSYELPGLKVCHGCADDEEDAGFTCRRT